jgi:hypothetical protein
MLVGSQREDNVPQLIAPTTRWSWLHPEEADVQPPGTGQSLGNLAIRISVVGRASPRWRTATSAAQADRLNQRLSELRAKNIYAAVEGILKRELPSLPIALSWKGVGSHDGFPTVGDDNPEIDRSVVVTIDLTTTRPDYKFKPHAPRRIYVPSKVWTLRVHSMFRGAALGYVQIFLRIGLINPYSGKEMIMSGWLAGGGSAMSVKDSFKMGRPDVRNMANDQVGQKVSFLTDEAMDFDEMNDNGQGQIVRLDKIDVSLGIRSYDTCLVFTGLKTRPALLCFEHKSLTLGWIKADAAVVAGRLRREGPNPGDYLELPSPDDIVPTQSTQEFHHGLLLTFPTEKAGLNDLTKKDRQRLTDFVVNQARNIGVLSRFLDVAGRRP